MAAYHLMRPSPKVTRDDESIGDDPGGRRKRDKKGWRRENKNKKNIVVWRDSLSVWRLWAYLETKRED
jgi:hypothetical protein